MNIREVAVGDLMDFIHREEYSQLETKPITPERAASQACNPCARAEDVALVYVSENNQLLAFAGILPEIREEGEKPVYSNSGWWIHPKLGRKYALPVFFKAFHHCQRRMFFTDCSVHTKTILEKTGLFNFQKPAAGKRFILRFYSGDLLRKKGINRFVSYLFSIADRILNYMVNFRIKSWRNGNLPYGFTVHPVDKIDEKLNDFIRQYSSAYYLRQDGEKLNWIVQNPWIAERKMVLPVLYPFSQVAESFHQEFLVVKYEKNTVAVLLLSIRDGHASVPYIYYNDKHLQNALGVIVNRLFQMKVKSLIVFHPGVVNSLGKINIPAIYSKRIFRYSGYSKEISGMFSGNKWFQDGEGDVAFT